MAPRELACGFELEGLRAITGTATTSTNSSYRDTTLTDCSIQIGTSAVVAFDFVNQDGSKTSLPIGSTLWAHLHFARANTSGGTAIIAQIYDINDIPRLRIFGATGSGLVIQQNTAGATPVWQDIITLPNATNAIIDVSFNTSTKAVDVFLSSEFSASGAYTIDLPDALAWVRVGSAGGSGNSLYVSQVLFTEDLPTVGATVKTLKAVAAGDLQQWDGAYTNITGIALNDSTTIMADTPDETTTYAYETLTVPEGMDIGGLWFWNRIKTDGSDPSNVKPLIRRSSVNYEKPSLPGLNLGYVASGCFWPVSPATGQKWTGGEFNASQLGLKASTT